MNLQFTFEFRSDSINFLDVTFTWDREFGIKVAPYRKPTASNATLLASSCHPPHVVRNVPIGELIHMKRNSTTSDIYETEKDNTFTCLKRTPISRLDPLKSHRWS